MNSRRQTQRLGTHETSSGILTHEDIGENECAEMNQKGSIEGLMLAAQIILSNLCGGVNFSHGWDTCSYFTSGLFTENHTKQNKTHIPTYFVKNL